MDQKSESLLTGAEARIVRLISLGCTHKEAATILGVAESTVSDDLASAMHKLDVQSAGALTKRALSLGLTSLDDRLAEEELAKLNGRTD